MNSQYLHFHTLESRHKKGYSFFAERTSSPLCFESVSDIRIRIIYFIRNATSSSLRFESVSDIRIRIIYFIRNATSFSLRFNSVSCVRTIKKEQHGCPQASLRHHTVLFLHCSLSRTFLPLQLPRWKRQSPYFQGDNGNCDLLCDL